MDSINDFKSFVINLCDKNTLKLITIYAHEKNISKPILADSSDAWDERKYRELKLDSREIFVGLKIVH